MEKKSQNSTTNYAPEKVTEAVEINFTRIVSGGNTTISGSIRKDGSEAGTVSFESSGNYLITSLKPYSVLTDEEVAAVYHAVPGCITEMLDNRP